MKRILRILLANYSHEDELVGSDEPSSAFFVPSAYKLLQSDPNLDDLQNISRDFYRKF